MCLLYIKVMCGHRHIVIINETCTITGYSLAITSFKGNEFMIDVLPAAFLHTVRHLSKGFLILIFI